ncbi:hypothetical protein JUJ52_02790 [Virgibacillus sp. AGTR]|uniref:hypothetical protein n=1 Tax=Virgibacillus sp. AGTR TaxID=2812055 RepID=UPI001D160F84|nr:hypothetical protein [Virgibacillus sp. AGTR]MCC2248884.1 hypothetical protein [Virgibacillus sp. AGTR]
MIYEDVYNFLLKKASAKEIDIILEMIRNTDWNGRLRIDISTLSKRVGTTKKYVKEIIHKFTSLKRGKHILKVDNSDPDFPYVMVLGKSSLFYNKGDKYGKKYGFLYSKEFQTLSVYAKRIILTAVMDVSLSNKTTASLRVSNFVYRDEVSTGLIPSKSTLYRTIEEINTIFSSKLKVSLATSFFLKKEVIRVSFDASYLEQVVHNHTERFELRKVLFEHGFEDYVSDDYCIEIERVAKYVFNSLITGAKQVTKENRNVTGLIDTMMNIARYVYEKALVKLSKSLYKVLDENEDTGALSAYFSAVLFSVMAEEMAKHQHQADTIQSLVEIARTDIKSESEQLILEHQSIAEVLESWCRNWVTSRVHKKESNRGEINEASEQHNNNLKDTIHNIVHTLTTTIRKLENNYTKLIRKNSYLADWMEQVKQYIDTINMRFVFT